MSNREKIIMAALLLAVIGTAYLGFVVARQRAVVAELDARLERAYRERDDLTRALAAAQKDVRDMDATLAKVQRVLEGMTRRIGAENAQTMAAARADAAPAEGVAAAGASAKTTAPAIQVPAQVAVGGTAAGTLPVAPAASVAVPQSPAGAAMTPPQASLPTKADAERMEAARAEARLLSIALLQAAVDYAGANAGQKPTDPAQLLPYLPPEMAEKLRQLLPEPRKE